MADPPLDCKGEPAEKNKYGHQELIVGGCFRGNSASGHARNDRWFALSLRTQARASSYDVAIIRAKARHQGISWGQTKTDVGPCQGLVGPRQGQPDPASKVNDVKGKPPDPARLSHRDLYHSSCRTSHGDPFRASFPSIYVMTSQSCVSCLRLIYG